MQGDYVDYYYYIYSKGDDRKGLVDKKLHERLPKHKIIRVIAGEGKLLVRKNFIETCERIGMEGDLSEGRIEFILFQDQTDKCDVDGKEVKLKYSKFLKILTENAGKLKFDKPTADDIYDFAKRATNLINRGVLKLMLAPKIPPIHFVLLDDDEIFLQEEHKPEEDKRHLHAVNNPELIGSHLKVFEERIRESKPIIIVMNGGSNETKSK
ncbi:hypothetical protein KKB18_01370 [bacterium]|nr:hypothetical protein [bacterium]